MKLKPTEESESAKNFFDSSGKLMLDLAERWVHEWQHERIEDYQKVIQKKANDFGVKITKMVQKPFGCEFEVDERTFRYTIRFSQSTSHVSYQRIK